LRGEAVDSILAALADPNRRAIVDRLRRQPQRAGEMAGELGLTPPALSRHLRVLRKSGLIREELLEEDARVRMCHLQKAPFEQLRKWLEEVESFWTLELAAFRDHVAKRKGKR